MYFLLYRFHEWAVAQYNINEPNDWVEDTIKYKTRAEANRQKRIDEARFPSLEFKIKKVD